VRSTEIVYRPRRQLVSRIEDSTGELALRFLQFLWKSAKALEPGASVRAFGEVRAGFFGGEMIHRAFACWHGATPLPTGVDADFIDHGQPWPSSAAAPHRRRARAWHNSKTRCLKSG